MLQTDVPNPSAPRAKPTICAPSGTASDQCQRPHVQAGDDQVSPRQRQRRQRHPAVLSAGAGVKPFPSQPGNYLQQGDESEHRVNGDERPEKRDVPPSRRKEECAPQRRSQRQRDGPDRYRLEDELHRADLTTLPLPASRKREAIRPGSACIQACARVYTSRAGCVHFAGHSPRAAWFQDNPRRVAHLRAATEKGIRRSRVRTAAFVPMYGWWGGVPAVRAYRVRLWRRRVLFRPPPLY